MLHTAGGLAGNLLRACESREQGRDGRDTPRGRRLGDDGVPRCPCAAPRLSKSMQCTSGHVVMSRRPRPPRRPRPNPVPMRTCCDMESCAHGTHCRTGSTCTVRSLLQLAGQSQAAQEKCHVGMAAAEKRARSKSAFMAAFTESLRPLRPACRAPVGRSAPASLLLVPCMQCESTRLCVRLSENGDTMRASDTRCMRASDTTYVAEEVEPL